MFKGKKMAGHMGDVRVTTQNLEVVAHRRRARPDLVERRGAGRQGRLDHGPRRGQARRCRTMRRSRARSAAGRRRGCSAAQPRPQASEESAMMELKVTHPRRRADAGTVELVDGDLRPRAARRHPAARGALAARQAAGRAPTRPRRAARSRRPTQEDVQAEGHRPRPPRLARRRSSAAAARRSARRSRSHAHDLPKKVRALGAEARAVGQGARPASSSSSTSRSSPRRKTKALAASFAKLGSSNALHHRRRRGRRELRCAAPQHRRASMCCRSRASTSTTSCAATRWS